MRFCSCRGFRRTANKRDFFEYLEQLGVKPNQVNSDGITPLYIVAGKKSRYRGTLLSFGER